MWMFKLIGCIELLVLLALMGLTAGSAMSWALGCMFLLVFFLTCAFVGATRIQFDGIFGNVLCGFTFWVVPALLLLRLLAPRIDVVLLAVGAFALLAEWARERKTGQCQLGWLPLPLMSIAVAIFAQTGSLLSAGEITVAAASLCATALFYFAMARIAKPVAKMQVTRQHRSLRSMGKAA